MRLSPSILLIIAFCFLSSAQTICLRAQDNLTPTRTLPSDPAAQTPPPASSPEAEEQDIRDIKEPLFIPSFMRMALILGAIFLSVLILGSIIYFLLRNRTKQIARLPHEIALEQLAQARALIEQNDAKSFSIYVSDSIRSYIEARFHERASHSTTEEFLNNMLAQEGNELAAYNGLLADFLKYCDLAKFAQWSFSPDEMNEMLDAAMRFVDETKPRPPEQKNPVA